jgi:hypothetical protein
MVRRIGNLFEQVIAPENLRFSFWSASCGKRHRPTVVEFGNQLDQNLAILRQELREETFAFGRFFRFRIHDPKIRDICAAPFRERVVHHALMRVTGPILDRALISDTYACRIGKGRTAAVSRAAQYIRTFPWVLKLDIYHYFDSVDQAILAGLLDAKFKDSSILRLFRSILSSYQVSPGKGVPIGNLTSQFFANQYLEPLDRMIKEGLSRSGYVRYMDDFLIFGASRGDLAEVKQRIEAFLHNRLDLNLKDNGSLHSTSEGVNFLGYRLQRVEPTESGGRGARAMVFLARRSKLRFRRKLTDLSRDLEQESISELDFQRRSLALSEFTQSARAVNFRRRTVLKLEIGVEGHPSGGPRRQLEQRSGELPLRLPEWQSPRQPEQQPRFPAGPGPSSTSPPEEGRGGTDGDSSGRV